MKIDIETFLQRNRISQETWAASALTYESLAEIYNDYTRFQKELNDCVEIYAKQFQRIQAVHSVRWRVKDPEHLLEKIIRKRAEGSDKYKTIDSENYFSIVTDLVGVRAIHLFKDGFSEIDQAIRSNWLLAKTEKPTINLRAGDSRANIDSDLFDVKEHPAGYRSVHYIAISQPAKRVISVEIQVRTLFEEGWSEIDHIVRYPNFSDNELIGYFLTIFNRLAGSADEMGSFVRNLASQLELNDAAINAALSERDKAILDVEQTILELSELRQESEGSRELIAKLKADISKLKSNQRAESATVSALRGDIARNASSAVMWGSSSGSLSAAADVLRSFDDGGAVAAAMRSFDAINNPGLSGINASVNKIDGIIQMAGLSAASLSALKDISLGANRAFNLQHTPPAESDSIDDD